MIDITKDEFWENRYDEVSKTEKKNSRTKEFIMRHKIITMLLVSLSLLITANIFLIYNFFRILNKL